MNLECEAAVAAPGIAGRELAFTGRLASMARAEALRRVQALGGSVAETPGAGTDVLVVGAGGPPLGSDGRLTQSLREARALQELGAPIRIVPEQEFVELVGLAGSDDLSRLFTTEQLARMLELEPRTIRAWVRHGLIRPTRVVRRLALFEFRAVATARALSRLTAKGVRPAAIRDSLERLRAWMGEGDQALAQLEAFEHSRLLVVRTEEGLAEPDGQLRLDFEAAGPGPGQAAPIEVRPAKPGPRALRLAPDWFERGAEAEEEGRLEEAAECYERAASECGQRPEILFNLGNVLYALERKADAVEALLSAVESEPEYVEAWNNLGNIMADVGEREQALDCFAHALELEPDYADAHYNLAELLAAEGDYPAARAHWNAYLALDPLSTTAERVRELLTRTRPR